MDGFDVCFDTIPIWVSFPLSFHIKDFYGHWCPSCTGLSGIYLSQEIFSIINISIDSFLHRFIWQTSSNYSNIRHPRQKIQKQSYVFNGTINPKKSDQLVIRNGINPLIWKLITIITKQKLLYIPFGHDIKNKQYNAQCLESHALVFAFPTKMFSFNQ